jgi:ribosomal protein L25 (general stress protein Ctc)
MKQISLSGSLRENVGRQGATELRRSGRVPGVLYGSGHQVHFSVSEMDLTKLFRQAETFQINLEIDGKSFAYINFIITGATLLIFGISFIVYVVKTQFKMQDFSIKLIIISFLVA